VTVCFGLQGIIFAAEQASFCPKISDESLLPPRGFIRQFDLLIIAMRFLGPAIRTVGCNEERAGSGKR
jgi:hypothetical protein